MRREIGLNTPLFIYIANQFINNALEIFDGAFYTRAILKRAKAVSSTSGGSKVGSSKAKKTLFMLMFCDVAQARFNGCRTERFLAQQIKNDDGVENFRKGSLDSTLKLLISTNKGLRDVSRCNCGSRTDTLFPLLIDCCSLLFGLEYLHSDF